MRISYWSSDVCSSDLVLAAAGHGLVDSAPAESRQGLADLLKGAARPEPRSPTDDLSHERVAPGGWSHLGRARLAIATGLDVATGGGCRPRLLVRHVYSSRRRGFPWAENALSHGTERLFCMVQSQLFCEIDKIGRATVCTPVTNA